MQILGQFPGVEKPFYETPDVFRGSSTTEYLSLLDIWEKIWDRGYRSDWRSYHEGILCPIFEVDRSSLNPPELKFPNETYHIESTTEEFILDGLLDHEELICIKPKKKYSLIVDVGFIKKGKPTSLDTEVY